MISVRVDHGPTPVDIDPALISDRNAINAPSDAGCLAVTDDALNPGHYLVVGWYDKPLYFIAPANP